MPSHSIAREQDAAADARDRTADVRDAAATHRDTTADDRDQVADNRDHVANRRDALADERDRLARTTPDEVGQTVTAAHLQRALTARNAAAADCHHAWSDRAAWAQDRVRAAGDRTRAEDDRAAASGDRGTAAQHRQRTDLDPLTGALHRGSGRVALLHEMTRANREHHPLVVAYIDVDQMKAVNDSGGYQAGDQLLRQVVAALRAAFRPLDLVVRQGGDEFLCILPGMRTADAKIRMKHVNTDLATTDRPGSVTAGFAQMHPEDNEEQLVHRADEDLYRTKPHGQPPTPCRAPRLAHRP